MEDLGTDRLDCDKRDYKILVRTYCAPLLYLSSES